MPQTNDIDVTVFPKGEDAVPVDFDAVNYISFVSSPGGQGEGTYGIPALLGNDQAAQRVKDEGLPATILYVNPANIACMKVTRNA